MQVITYACPNLIYSMLAKAVWVGLLKLHLLISRQEKFSVGQKYPLDYLNHIYIWQVPPQLSCGGTCQI